MTDLEIYRSRAQLLDTITNKVREGNRTGMTLTQLEDWLYAHQEALRSGPRKRLRASKAKVAAPEQASIIGGG